MDSLNINKSLVLPVFMSVMLESEISAMLLIGSLEGVLCFQKYITSYIVGHLQYGLRKFS